MVLIGKVSRGSRMDQIYVPKNRVSFAVGSYVLIKPIEAEEELKDSIRKLGERLCLYNLRYIEPIKLEIIDKIFNIIGKAITTRDYENMLITGSFLEPGFNFNDIDILIITKKEISGEKGSEIEQEIKKEIGTKAQVIMIDNKSLIEGLSTDPLYQMMLSKCIAKKRLIYRFKNKINQKILDLHLLKSKALMDGLYTLNGNEKYSLTRNMVAIKMFLKNEKLSKESVDKEIEAEFNLENIKAIKNNVVRGEFLSHYKQVYKDTFNKIMRYGEIKDDSK